jgi:hypothetical protein
MSASPRAVQEVEALALRNAVEKLSPDFGLILDCLNQMEGRGAEDRVSEIFDTLSEILGGAA